MSQIPLSTWVGGHYFLTWEQPRRVMCERSKNNSQNETEEKNLISLQLWIWTSMVCSFEFATLALEFRMRTNTAECLVCHIFEADRKALGASRWADRAVLGSKRELRNVQTRTADSPRGSSPLAPSTVSPKYLPPPLGVRPPSPPPRPCRSCVPLSEHMRAHTNQSSCFRAERVWRVEELEAGLWVVGDLLPVLEPLVLRLGEALLLHAAQLGWLSKRHWFWDTAFWHHRLYCGDIKHNMVMVFMGSFTPQISFCVVQASQC